MEHRPYREAGTSTGGKGGGQRPVLKRPRSLPPPSAQDLALTSRSLVRMGSVLEDLAELLDLIFRPCLQKPLELLRAASAPSWDWHLSTGCDANR